jgi:hypothetical protein
MQPTCKTIYKNRNRPVFSHLIILLAKQLTAMQKLMVSYEQKELGYNSKKGGWRKCTDIYNSSDQKGSGQWVKELGSSL